MPNLSIAVNLNMFNMNPGSSPLGSQNLQKYEKSYIAKLVSPNIIGNKYANTNEKYIAERQFENEKQSWVLIGNNYEFSTEATEFSVPDDLKNGQYTLVCRISANGEESASSKIIVVNKLNNDDSASEKIFDQFSPELEVYPNPANDFVNIKLNNIEPVNTELLVRTISGKTVLTKRNMNSEISVIDISTLQKGIYFIELLKNGKQVDIKKLIK